MVIDKYLEPRAIRGAAPILLVDGTSLGLRQICWFPVTIVYPVLIQHSVTIVDASVGQTITTLNATNVYELGFSPLGTYIITWQRPSKDDNGDAVKNLKVWRIIEGQHTDGEDEHVVVGRFVQKSQTGWNLQYTHDEKYCARVVTNEVQLYESAELGKVWDKIRVEGVIDFAVSPAETHSIAVFVPERKVRSAYNLLWLSRLTMFVGATSVRKNFQCTKLCCSRLAKEFFQGRQSPIEMEQARHKSDSVSHHRC